MNLFKFIFSKWFVVNVFGAIIVLLVGIYFVTNLLGEITLHNKTITVPDLKTYSILEVEETLGNLSLEYKVIDSSAYTTKFPKNSVVKQDPVSGIEVKEGRVIYLTVNPSGFRSVQVPYLVGKTSRQAVSYLKTVGFKVGKFEYRPDIGKNVVLDMKYRGKILDSLVTLPKESVIDLVLGAGLNSEKTTLPNFIGDDISVAKKKLVEMSLNLGKVRYDGGRNDAEKYFIYKQYPNYHKNSKLKIGSVIDLWLTSDSSKLTKITSDSLSVE
ncbi:MAG: PASTA domain-containing protein [Bacteroidota bacterium]